METCIINLKQLFRLGLIVGVLLTTQCKKEDPVPILPEKSVTPEKEEEFESVNTEPSAPLLTLPENGDELVALTSMFSWQEATDLESDAITYNVYLGRNGQPLTSIANNITTTDFLLETPLEKGQNYQWRVDAVDEKGALKASETFSFITEYNTITQLTESAPFSKRKNAALISFRDKIFLLGGENEAGEPLAEVWSSSDGVSWNMETNNAAFGPRKSAAVVVFQGKLWMYSGTSDTSMNQYIWSSEDGINWIQEENDRIWNNTPFLGQSHTTMFVHDGKIWRFAAYDGSIGDLTTERHVWNSADGKNWTLITENHGFNQKYGMKIVSFQGQLIAFEGSPLSETKTSIIRSSVDALDWSIVTENPPFQIGFYSDAIVHKERLYVTGGLTYEELWFTDNGTNWKKAVQQRDYPIKSGNTSVNHNDRLYIIGGNRNQVANDIWRID